MIKNEQGVTPKKHPPTRGKQLSLWKKTRLARVLPHALRNHYDLDPNGIQWDAES